MSFVQEYNQSFQTINYSEEFYEGGSSFIYTVGKSNNGTPTILKADTKGNLIWQKEYYPNGWNDNFAFKKIIQIQNQGAISYLLNCKNDTTETLVSIDKDGNVNYTNQVSTSNPIGDCFLVNSKVNSDYYYAYSGLSPYNYGSDSLSQIIILQFNADGTLINQGYFYTGSADDIFIRSVVSHDNGVTVLADQKGNSSIIEFDYFNLDVVLHKLIISQTGSTYEFISHDIVAVTTSLTEPYKNKYFVSAYYGPDSKVFIFTIDCGGYSFYSKLENSSDSSSSLCYFDNNLLISIINDTYSRVDKFNTAVSGSLLSLWSREYIYSGGSQGVRRITYNALSDNIVCSSMNNSLLFYDDTDLKNCISQELFFELPPAEVFYLGDGDLYRENVDITIQNISTYFGDYYAGANLICERKATVNISATTSLQSPNFYIQAVGSTGFDSTKGFQLRWLLKGALDKHLPKGNYATNTFNFNKQNDFVKIYRAPYVDLTVTLDLSVAPNLVIDSRRQWMYVVDGNTFYVYFRDVLKYQTARLNYNPNTQPTEFITAYGEGLIEVENKAKLSFSVSPKFQILSENSAVKVELLSIEKNLISADKYTSFRSGYATNDLNNRKLVSENVRSVRFYGYDAVINKVDFEFYYNFIENSNVRETWEDIGKYALTKNTNLAHFRLEPEAGLVHEKWLRYNDEAYVNIENYKEKWNGSIEEQEKISFVVDKYIELSDLESNPTATETFSLLNENVGPVNGFTPDPDYNPSDPNSSNQFEISNLQLLQVASLDFHVARMLGLGTLDYKEELFEGKYIYAAEYITYGDLGDGLGAREVQHVYCTLPTTIEDERLSLPIDIKEVKPGVYYGHGTESPQVLTDSEGYTHDGRTRYLTLYHEPLHDELPNEPFFANGHEFDSSTYTEPVYAGLEYKLSSNSIWRKPELPFDIKYFNIDTTVPYSQSNETVPILIPEPGNPLFIHREKQPGEHTYSSYGINWFSRGVSSSMTFNVNTIFPVINTLLPPTNINALLIRKESPLLLTSLYEQQRLNSIATNDKTLIRLTFDYNHTQELIDYHKAINGVIINGYNELDNEDEVFADEIEVFFRNEIPNTISGKILTVSQDPTNELLCIVTTEPFVLTSSTTIINGNPSTETIEPVIPSGLNANFVGSVMRIDEKEFIVHEVIVGTNQFPEFKVFKRAINGTQVGFADVSSENLETPEDNKLFIVVENMLSENSWNSPAPISFKVGIDPQISTVHNEEVFVQTPDALTVEGHIQKFRGIYRTANIQKFLEDVEVYEDENDLSPTIIHNQHQGIYKIEFTGFTLNQHYQHSETNHSVEWFNGVVRLHMIGQDNKPRKEYKVVKTENIGVPGQNLILYILDPEFSDDNPNIGLAGYIKTGNQIVAFYPGYKVYFHADQNNGFTEEAILPLEDEGEKYSIFGLRSHRVNNNLHSKISTPVLMFAKEITEPLRPALPKGGKYATRPDFYGKSTYTFRTAFANDHKPYSIQFNRTSDIQILSAIYNQSTVDSINDVIFKRGEETFYVNRWEDFLSFEYEDGLFKLFDLDGEMVRLPLPNNTRFIASINAFIDEHNNFYNNLPNIVSQLTEISSLNQIVVPGVPGRNGELLVKDFIKNVIHNCFVPLTEVPVIYRYVKKESDGYVPIPKKQVIRDRNGNLLPATHPEFDMAPMMVKLTPNQGVIPTVGSNEVQFTDYGLDGASNAKYFYTVREFDLQMKTGEYSPILGPISLVNTLPPTAPEILKVTPVLESRVLNISPKIQFEINAYKGVQNIKKVNIYRALNRLDSLSIRTMQLVKVIDVEVASFDENSRWSFTDDFSDLPEIPYGDPLFYSLTVSRQIKYIDKDGSTIIDYAPSEASKVVLTNIVENYSPESPVMQYHSEPLESEDVHLNYITLSWNKTVYKGKYHLYKMNSQGNWVKIHEVTTNEDTVYVQLEETELNNPSLRVISDDGSKMYHHFKVIAENTSGMLSSKENILTIYNEVTWNDVGGIGTMIVGRTFRVR